MLEIFVYSNKFPINKTVNVASGLMKFLDFDEDKVVESCKPNSPSSTANRTSCSRVSVDGDV